jgi:hypothetical protein
MRKISLFTGIVATVIGLGAVATAGSAFAEGCLTAQQQLPPISLSQDSMIPNAGFGYDNDAYDAALAKGNICTTTQQSQPVSDETTTAKKPRTSYN